MTHGASPPHRAPGTPTPAAATAFGAAAAWGVLRVAASELPHVRVHAVDVSDAASRAAAAALPFMGTAGPAHACMQTEHACNVHAGTCTAARLLACAVHGGCARICAAPLPGRGLWAISGGTGALGALAAGWLAAAATAGPEGVCMLLLGRSGRPAPHGGSPSLASIAPCAGSTCLRRCAGDGGGGAWQEFLTAVRGVSRPACAYVHACMCLFAEA